MESQSGGFTSVEESEHKSDIENIDGPEDSETFEAEDSEYDNVDATDYRNSQQPSYDKTGGSEFDEPTEQETSAAPKTKRLAKRGTVSKKELTSQSIDHEPSTYLSAGGSEMKNSQSSSQPSGTYHTANTHLESASDDASDPDYPKDDESTSMMETSRRTGTAHGENATTTRQEEPGATAHTSTDKRQTTSQLSNTVGKNSDVTYTTNVRSSTGSEQSESTYESTYVTNSSADEYYEEKYSEHPYTSAVGETAVKENEPNRSEEVETTREGSNYYEYETRHETRPEKDKQASQIANEKPDPKRNEKSPQTIGQESGANSVQNSAALGEKTGKNDDEIRDNQPDKTEKQLPENNKEDRQTTGQASRGQSATESVVLEEKVGKPDDKTSRFEPDDKDKSQFDNTEKQSPENKENPQTAGQAPGRQSATENVVLEEKVGKPDDKSRNEPAEKEKHQPNQQEAGPERPPPAEDTQAGERKKPVSKVADEDVEEASDKDIVLTETVSRPDDETSGSHTETGTHVSESNTSTIILDDEDVEDAEDENTEGATPVDTQISVTHQDNADRSNIENQAGERSGNAGSHNATNAAAGGPNRVADRSATHEGGSQGNENENENLEARSAEEGYWSGDGITSDSKSTVRAPEQHQTNDSASDNAPTGTSTGTSRSHAHGMESQVSEVSDSETYPGSNENPQSRPRQARKPDEAEASPNTARQGGPHRTPSRSNEMNQNEEAGNNLAAANQRPEDKSKGSLDKVSKGAESMPITHTYKEGGGVDDGHAFQSKPTGTSGSRAHGMKNQVSKVPDSETYPESNEHPQSRPRQARKPDEAEASPNTARQGVPSRSHEMNQNEEAGNNLDAANQRPEDKSKGSLDKVSKGAESMPITHTYKEGGGVDDGHASQLKPQSDEKQSEEDSSEPQIYLDDEEYYTTAKRDDKTQPANAMVPRSDIERDRNTPASRGSRGRDEMEERSRPSSGASRNRDSDRDSRLMYDPYGKDSVESDEEDESGQDPSEICDVKKTKKDHRTDKFEDDVLIVRRGFNIQFSKKDINEVTLKKCSSKFAKRESERNVRKFHREFVLSFADEDTEYSGWELMRDKDNQTTSLQIVANAIVGRWHLYVDDKGPYEMIVLFNPWCEKDLVYMENEESAEAYVLEDAGYIFKSGDRKRAWYYGQFDEGVLAIVLELLDRSYLTMWGKASPIRVCRAMTSIINANDGDNGLLRGQWVSPYSGGTKPTLWDGSVEILETYGKTGKSVKYGQCWVFAGCLTTVLRCLGIPCRCVTCTGSFVDKNGNLIADTYFDEDGNMTDNESVWNFHVWNEAWMKRPDVQPNFDGWQAVDATPEERREGLCRTGPAPVGAVRSGHCHCMYDTGVVFAAVNADRASWERNRRDDFILLKIKNSPSIGKSVITSRLNTEQPQDITKNYKPKEGSDAERRQTRRAVHAGSEPSIYEMSRKKKDAVKIESDLPSFITVGKDLKFKISVAGNSEQDDNLKIVFTISCRILSNTGKLLKNIFNEQKNMKLPADSTYKGTITKKDYEDFDDDENVIHVAVHCKADREDEATVEYFMVAFDAQAPKMSIRKGPPYFIGQELNLRLSYDNDTGKTLNKCFFKISAPGIKDKSPYHLRKPMEPNEHRNIDVEYTPKREGKITIVVSFGCKEFPVRNRNYDITVKK